MGHTEMSLAVVGLNQSQIETATKRLASGDWSGFPPEFQAGFKFTRKQAKHPASLTAADYAELERDLGKDKAWQLIWWASRCHYMTRFADAFQMPLERDNVFLDPLGKGPMR
jgi:hypothetical protein